MIRTRCNRTRSKTFRSSVPPLAERRSIRREKRNEPACSPTPDDMLTRTAECVAGIRRYNTGREPERLTLKYLAMSQSPFAFFRGTAHVLWEDARAAASSLPDGPAAWGCGDLHLENFGSYRGANRLAYFDMNDFDDAALGPAPCE